MEFLPQFHAGHVIIPLVEYVSMDERLEVAANLERLRQKASKEPCEHLIAVITQMLPETPTLPIWAGDLPL